MKDLDLRALEQVAGYFQALAEPTRLQLLNAMRDGEVSVGELARVAGCSQANVSKHLSLLAGNGLVERRPEGNSVYYRIRDADVYKLCDLVCGQIAARLVGNAELQRQMTLAAKGKRPSR